MLQCYSLYIVIQYTVLNLILYAVYQFDIFCQRTVRYKDETLRKFMLQFIKISAFKRDFDRSIRNFTLNFDSVLYLVSLQRDF